MDRVLELILKKSTTVYNSRKESKASVKREDLHFGYTFPSQQKHRWKKRFHFYLLKISDASIKF